MRIPTKEVRNVSRIHLRLTLMDWPELSSLWRYVSDFQFLVVFILGPFFSCGKNLHCGFFSESRALNFPGFLPTQRLSRDDDDEFRDIDMLLLVNLMNIVWFGFLLNTLGSMNQHFELKIRLICNFFLDSEICYFLAKTWQGGFRMGIGWAASFGKVSNSAFFFVF